MSSIQIARKRRKQQIKSPSSHLPVQPPPEGVTTIHPTPFYSSFCAARASSCSHANMCPVCDCRLYDACILKEESEVLEGTKGLGEIPPLLRTFW